MKVTIVSVPVKPTLPDGLDSILGDFFWSNHQPVCGLTHQTVVALVEPAPAIEEQEEAYYAASTEQL
jgi:hypothetical protein